MKKIGKVLFAGTMFFVNANKVFATSAETSSSGIGDVLPFIFGVIAVVAVLFLAYKLDKSSENAPTIKKTKAHKAKRNDKAIEKKETEIYAQEN